MWLSLEHLQFEVLTSICNLMMLVGIDPKRQQVVLFDRHMDGPYIELIKKAFSPNHPVLRHHDYKQQMVLFKHIVFHLESPAGLTLTIILTLTISLSLTPNHNHNHNS